MKVSQTRLDLWDRYVIVQTTKFQQNRQIYGRFISLLDKDFAKECIQFKYFIRALREENREENYNMAEILQVLRTQKIVATYRNFDTALKLFLTIRESWGMVRT